MDFQLIIKIINTECATGEPAIIMLLLNLSRNAEGNFQGNPWSWQFCVPLRGEETEDNFLHGFAAHLSVHKKHGAHTNTVENAKNLQRHRLESRPVHAVCMVEENFWCTTQKTDDNTIIQYSLILYYLEATYRFEMFNWLFVIPKIRIPNSSEVVLSSKPLHKSTDKSYQPALLEPTEKKMNFD